MGIKLTLLIVFFAVMVGVGLYSRKHTASVDGFVLGGRSVGPLAYSICIWNLLFLCSCICWVCRSVWLEVRYCKYVDWNR